LAVKNWLVPGQHTLESLSPARSERATLARGQQALVVVKKASLFGQQASRVFGFEQQVADEALFTEPQLDEKAPPKALVRSHWPGHWGMLLVEPGQQGVL